MTVLMYKLPAAGACLNTSLDICVDIYACIRDLYRERKTLRENNSSTSSRSIFVSLRPVVLSTNLQYILILRENVKSVLHMHGWTFSRVKLIFPFKS